MTDVESRIARLEERVITLQDNYVQTRLAHEDLNQRIEVANITLSTMNQRFITTEAAISMLQAGIDKISERQEWVVKLIIGLVITAWLSIIMSGVLMHLK